MPQPQETEPHYRLLWETTTDAVLVIDERSIIRYANPAMQAVFGHCAQAVVGKPLACLQPERLRQAHGRGLAAYLATGHRRLDWRSVETVGLHQDGHEFPLEVSFSEVEVGGTRMFGGFLRDISERVRGEGMQAALHKISEAAHSAPDLQDMFRRIHGIISELLPAKNFYVALYDRQTDLVSFPYWIDEVDPAPAPRLLREGRGLTEYILRSGESLLVSPDSWPALAARSGAELVGTDGVDWLGIPLNTQRGTIGVLTVQTYSGSIRYTDKHKELLQFVSHQVAAVVERKLAEASLLESEEQFKSAFEHSAIGMALVGLDGGFLKVNSSLCAIVGYPEEQLLRKSFQDITHPDDLDLDLRNLESLLAGEIQSYSMVKRYFHREGGVVLILLAVSMVRDKSGKPKHFISQIEDITERRRAEQWQQHYADTLGLITAEAPLAEVLDSLASFAERQAAGMSCSIRLLSPDGRRLLYGSQDLSARAGAGACWSHPILSADNHVLGTFEIHRLEPSAPGANEIELIRQSAALAAIALERAQHNEDRRLAKVVFEQSIEGIMVTDPEHRVLMVNHSFESLTGYGAPEVIGQTQDILDDALHEPALQEEIRASLAGCGRWKGELWGRKKSGEVYPLAMSVATVNDASGALSHYISIITDVSEQKIQAARIEQLAFYDSLTGLPNRALFLDRLEQTLAASRRHGGHGAILFLDLDRFKEINDSLGHAVGDFALAEVARRFQAASRREETLARLGGDEFVLIAENADHQAAVRIAARLQRALAEPLDLMGQPYIVGASIGIAFFPDDGQTSEDLIKRTDIAMYRAKAAGGGYRLYQAEMGAELEKRLTIAKRLGQAMDARELQLYYQPQVDLASGKLIGAEALLRWKDSVLGWISPAEFIPIAEERGMMGPLGDWVLAEACRQVKAWAEMGVALNGRLAINVSALQMEDPGIVGRLLGIVQRAGLSPEQFELELTESSMMVDPDRAVDVLESLSDAGFGLSIDDFGTGYSSLAYLKRFAADQIKIDMSFVRNMLTDGNDRTIVTTIIAMARSLGLRTTAEGVEEAGQAAALLALGCDFAQGYHYGWPEPAQAFMEKWLRRAVLA